jgi:phosphoglycolate phosphatase-like HAD superfamily hydrolase
MTLVRAVAIDLDALGDTSSLWNTWLASVADVLGVDPGALSLNRAEAASELDRLGAGNWRALLERYCEEHAAVHLRRDATTSAALRTLAASGSAIGVFTDAPEPLARVALAQVGAERRASAVETGTGALGRLLVALGDDAVVVRSRTELLEAIADA